MNQLIPAKTKQP